MKKKFLNKDLLFYVVMFAFPIIQFSLMYVGVNGRSFLYAFQVVYADGSVKWTLDSLDQAFKALTDATFLKYIGTSLLGFLLCYGIGTTLALLFSYFIYKKLPLGGFFKVVLFIPSILSAIVMGVIFRSVVEKAIPTLAKTWLSTEINGLLSNPSTALGTVIFYNIFISFGTNVLMYSNAMSGISPDIIEAGRLDGCTPAREFFKIIIPNIFPTIATFTITSVAMIFTNQLQLFSLYGTSAETGVITMGYDLYVRVVFSGNKPEAYPFICAVGLLLTVVAVPTTLLTKYLLEKFGPSAK